MSIASKYGVVIPNGLMAIGALAALAAAYFTPMPNRIALFISFAVVGVGAFWKYLTTKVGN